MPCAEEDDHVQARPPDDHRAAGRTGSQSLGGLRTTSAPRCDGSEAVARLSVSPLLTSSLWPRPPSCAAVLGASWPGSWTAGQHAAGRHQELIHGVFDADLKHLSQPDGRDLSSSRGVCDRTIASSSAAGPFEENAGAGSGPTYVGSVHAAARAILPGPGSWIVC